MSKKKLETPKSRHSKNSKEGGNSNSSKAIDAEKSADELRAEIAERIEAKLEEDEIAILEKSIAEQRADGHKKKNHKFLTSLGRSFRNLLLIFLAFIIVCCGTILVRGNPFFMAVAKDAREELTKKRLQIDKDNDFPEDVVEVLGDKYSIYYQSSREGLLRTKDDDLNSVGTPLIIGIHGGGLIAGDKNFNKHFNARLAQRGFVVASVEYPLAPEHDFFEILDSLSRSIDEISELATSYGADGKEVYLLGDSSGALLAVYTAALYQNPSMVQDFGVTPPSTKIRALGLMSGMFYTTKADQLGIFLSNQIYGNLWRFSKRKRWLDPKYLVAHVDLPSAILTTSDDDMLRQYSLDFYDLLTGDHVDSELLDFDGGLKHDFAVFEPSCKESSELIDGLATFFENH